MPDWSDGGMTPGSAVVAAVHEALFLVAVLVLALRLLRLLQPGSNSALRIDRVCGCIGGGVGPLLCSQYLALSM